VSETNTSLAWYLYVGYNCTSLTALNKKDRAELSDQEKMDQYASGDPAGGSQLIFGIQLLLEANKNFCLMSLDIKNASTYVGLGSGEKLKAAPFLCEEGMQQGAIESMPLFNLGIYVALKSSHDRIKESGGAILAGADDTYIVGPPDLAFQLCRTSKIGPVS